MHVYWPCDVVAQVYNCAFFYRCFLRQTSRHVQTASRRCMSGCPQSCSVNGIHIINPNVHVVSCVTNCSEQVLGPIAFLRTAADGHGFRTICMYELPKGLLARWFRILLARARHQQCHEPQFVKMTSTGIIFRTPVISHSICRWLFTGPAFWLGSLFDY